MEDFGEEKEELSKNMDAKNRRKKNVKKKAAIND